MKELVPFSMTSGSVAPANVEPDLTKAVEITPMVRFGVMLMGAPIVPSAPNQSPNHQVVEEVETPADADPKVASSSVIDSASPSPSDTIENGPQATDLTTPVHPSTLSEFSEAIADAERDLKNAQMILPMQIG